MNLPSIRHGCWVAFAQGKIPGPFELLAVRILAMRMRIASQRSTEPGDLERRVNEVYSFFLANQHLAQNDLKRIVEVES